jgi:hypothetical protein
LCEALAVRFLLPWLLALGLLGCATSERAHVPVEPPLESHPMQLGASPTLAFVHGPSTASAGGLRKWLEHQHDTVRLPVLVTKGASGQILTGTKELFPLSLDDSALGVSLADRVRTACPDADQSPRATDQCALWLEGTWRNAGLFVTRVLHPVSAEERTHYVQLEVPDGRIDLAAQLEKLGSEAPLTERREAADALRLAGRDAIPLLIASLDDARPFEVRDLTNRMNLPVGAHPTPLLATLSVGSRCEDLLQDIITPVVESGGNFKVFSEQVLQVPDWRAFWAKRHDRSLEQIHAELAPLVREYWKAHGTTQTVP